MQDWRSAPVDEKLAAALSYLEKLVSPQQSVDGADIQRMSEAGVTRLGMEEATLIAFCFQTLTRMSDAMDWPLPSDEGLKSAAQFLHKNGYATVSLPG